MTAEQSPETSIKSDNSIKGILSDDWNVLDGRLNCMSYLYKLDCRSLEDS
jgi:hypothetical protein